MSSASKLNLLCAEIIKEIAVTETETFLNLKKFHHLKVMFHKGIKLTELVTLYFGFNIKNCTSSFVTTSVYH